MHCDFTLGSGVPSCYLSEVPGAFGAHDGCDRAGLESSDEEEYQENGEEGDAGGEPVDEAAGGEPGALQSPGGRSGRLLKRPREEGSLEQQANGLEDDDMEDAAPVEVWPLNRRRSGLL